MSPREFLSKVARWLEKWRDGSEGREWSWRTGTKGKGQSLEGCEVCEWVVGLRVCEPIGWVQVWPGTADLMVSPGTEVVTSFVN